MSSRRLILLVATCAVFGLGGTSFSQTSSGQDSSNSALSVAPPASSELALPAAHEAPEPPALSQPPADRTATAALNSLRARDPFWPVGYVPPTTPPPVEKKIVPVPVAASPALTGPDWARALERVKVQGIVGGHSGRFFATVNNKVVEPGDEVAVTFEGSVYRWRIRSIGAKGIVTEPLSVHTER